MSVLPDPKAKKKKRQIKVKKRSCCTANPITLPQSSGGIQCPGRSRPDICFLG